MQIIYGGGYSNKEKEDFKIKVFRNIFVAMTTMIGEMEILKIQYKDPESQVGLFQISYIRVCHFIFPYVIYITCMLWKS